MSEHLNTSHVILYRHLHAAALVQQTIFKYISCYSLSWAKEYGVPDSMYLNTSHVILYRNEVVTEKKDSHI